MLTYWYILHLPLSINNLLINLCCLLLLGLLLLRLGLHLQLMLLLLLQLLDD